MEKVTAIVKLVVAFCMSFVQFFSPFAKILTNLGTDAFFDDWSVSDEFTSDYAAATLEKKPDKDFIVLNIADVQLSADEVYGNDGAIAEETIDKLIKETNPDLITLSGDNAWSCMAYIRICEVIDSYGIPWAPVMGNHDGNNGSKIMECWDSILMDKCENCVFKFGPKEMGFGNYIINITEDGKIIHTLFMMDTHSDSEDTDAGVINYGKCEDDSDKTGYDHLWANQLEWYKWAVNGIKNLEGHVVESSVIYHIPCIEYRYAMNEKCDITYNEDGSFKHAEPKAEYTDDFGSIDEWICSPEGNNGFFDLCLELGSTKNMIAGHDHINNMSVEYKGIRLSYSLKCGPGCYWNSAKNGGSLLTIDNNGHATFSHHYITVD